MNKTHTFIIGAGDNGSYGPMYGPVLADEICIIKKTGNPFYYLNFTLRYDTDLIEYYVVSPRYKGYSLNDLFVLGE